MPDDLPPGDKAVIATLEIVAFALGWNAVDRIVDGKSLLVAVPMLLACVSTSYAGFKWPQIKPKISPRFTSLVERITSNRLCRRAVYSVVLIAVLLSVGMSASRYYWNHLSAKVKESQVAATSQNDPPATAQNAQPQQSLPQSQPQPQNKPKQKTKSKQAAAPQSTTPPTYNVTTPIGSIVNQNSTNFGSQTVVNGRVGRRVPEWKKPELIALLSPNPGKFQILVVNGEDTSFAQDWQGILRSSSWDDQPFSSLGTYFPPNPFKGVLIMIPGTGHEPAGTPVNIIPGSPLDELIRAMQALNVELNFDGVPMPPNTVRLNFGKNDAP